MKWFTLIGTQLSFNESIWKETETKCNKEII